MATCPAFVEAPQPWPQFPADDEDSGRRTRSESDRGNLLISVPISPGSRLYERSFSHEVRHSSVSSHAVLQCGGLVLGNGNEGHKHGVYSEDLDGEILDFFISHNWSVHRWKKFLALCLVWNGRKALISCVCVQFICFTLVSLGLLPVSISELDGHEISVWCIGGCLVAYVVVFLVRHEIFQLLGFHGHRIFLDKVCVDQSDDERKREGIQGITAFLYHSEVLVVLYSELYLKKLWTVFELTTFLALKPQGELVVQPVILGPLAVYFVFIQCLRIPELFLVPLEWQKVASLDFTSTLGAYVIVVLDAVSLILGAIFLRMWGRTRANMAQQIEGFRIDLAECEVEADRIEILGAIKALARQQGLVPADASTTACAQSFERLVRDVVPRRMERAFRFTGITCQIACLMALPSMALVLDLGALRLRQLGTLDAQAALAEILQDAVFETWMPISIGIAGIVSGVAHEGWLWDVVSILGCFVVLVLGVWTPTGFWFPGLVADLPWSAGTRCLVSGSILVLQLVLLYFLFYSGASCWRRR